MRRRTTTWGARGTTGVLALSLGLVALLGSAGCSGDPRETILPEIFSTKVPEATAVGSESCVDCHEAEPAFYKQAYHRQAFFHSEMSGGCESCHGKGSVHSDYYYENEDYQDDPHDLVGIEDLGAMSASEKSALCQQCHQQDFPLWPTSDHARSQVGCWDCHPNDLHAPPSGAIEILPVVSAQSDNDYCVQCHESVSAEFDLQFHHRVPEGQMKCADCHPIHGDPKLNALVSGNNQTCQGCHPEVQGPWVYEHLGMEEGCEACHTPHGSVNNKLLIANDNSLCYQCHFQDPASFFGRQPHGITGSGNFEFLGAGALCYDCHFQVHGSNTHRSLNPRRF
jgi:DmsE family decaheme c-type cytochrome